jgi:hypothetical protein
MPKPWRVLPAMTPQEQDFVKRQEKDVQKREQTRVIEQVRFVSYHKQAVKKSRLIS